MHTAPVSEVPTKLVANDEEDPHAEQQPVQPGVVKAHLVGDQRPNVRINGVVSRTHCHDEGDPEDNPAILQQAELFAEGALELRSITGHQPNKSGKDQDGQSGDHPETVVPGEGGTDHRPNRNPHDGGNTEAGEDPGD